MAVKILTFHRALNYGAVLQCVALYKKVAMLNEDTYVYDYITPKMKDSYKVFKPQKTLGGNIAQIITLPIKLRKKRRFEKFLYNNVKLTKNVNDNDVLITGSDQVFNYRASDFDKTYFLDFVKDNCNKNSYAASFGLNDIEDIYKDDYRTLLEGFNHLSVREERGKELVNELCGRECEIMPDPVFLMTPEEWKTYGSVCNKMKEDYILLYLMAKTPSAVAFARALSKKTGLKVCFIDNYELKLMREFSIKRGTGPDEWINLFYNAKYVVTNSFHGTAFSILFNKELFVELLPESYGVNSRIENILSKYGLSDRIINGKKVDEFSTGISYDSINEKIADERSCAESYLKHIINGDVNEIVS